MRNSYLFTLILIVLCVTTFSQEKRPISHDDYEKWETITSSDLSNDGSTLFYLLNPQQQDGNLIFHNLKSGDEVRVPRGSKAAFSSGNGFAVFHIEPPQALVRQAKVEKKKRDQMPKDSLGILILNSNQILKYQDVASYQLPKEPSDWIAFSVDFEEIQASIEPVEITPSDTIPEPESKEENNKTRKPEKYKQLIISNPIAGITHIFDRVEAYAMAENGRSVLFLQRTKDEKDSLKLKMLQVFDIQNQTLQLIDSAKGDYKQLNLSKNGELFTWLFSADTTKIKTYDLFVHETGRRARTRNIDMQTPNMPEGYAVSEFRKPEFSDDNTRLFFGIASKPVQEPKDTLLEEEKYSVDVWHWQDPLLQTQQKANLKREQERNFEAVFHLSSGKMIPLADKTMPEISKDRYGNAAKAMGSSGIPYQREISWMGRQARDIFVVDHNTGERKMIIEKAEANVNISLAGNYIISYDPQSEAWFSYTLRDGSKRNLTSLLQVPFYVEDNDVPAFARPHGLAGWGKDDAFVLLYDRFDIWKIDPSGKTAAINITGGYGRENQIRFRYQNLDREELHIPENEIYLSAFNEQNKQSGYYKLNMKNLRLTSLVMEDASYSQLQKAKDVEQFIWRRSTFTEFPDIRVSKTDFSDAKKISAANAWQDEYLWGSVQLVEWSDFRNQTLQGLLYLPEDFNPEKKYPMIVYFYERTSNGLHRHMVPSPSRSTINASYCTSNGYIVFMPDITYQTGFPGQSAYNAIVSGTQAMAERYPFIDRDRMALQGQSWGGYQIAYLVTKTNMFRAAMAGAPVSNMVSAYGGIRWESGMVRQFQYEQTQSRIGGTLWEKPFHYIENSPVFFAPDINTPLLIMHNDNDGAVPWYQGIELFTAMRRLEKPVWMLVYNKEAHNLREWPARMDLSVRMYQFFDHFLKDEPAPRWLRDGIPYLQKGKDDGYDLVE
jgi:dipeptidyl aminopeptidase/acylaminoacyl peptidase